MSCSFFKTVLDADHLGMNVVARSIFQELIIIIIFCLFVVLINLSLFSAH